MALMYWRSVVVMSVMSVKHHSSMSILDVLPGVSHQILHMTVT